MSRIRLSYTLSVINFGIASLIEVYVRATGQSWEQLWNNVAWRAAHWWNAPAITLQENISKILNSALAAAGGRVTYGRFDVLIYLACIALLWYFVGDEIDRMRAHRVHCDSARSWCIARDVGLVCLGVEVALVGLHEAHHRQPYYFFDFAWPWPLHDALLVIWSLVLVGLFGRDLIVQIRRPGSTG